MDDLPSGYAEYSGPDHDSGKGNASPGTYRFFVLSFATFIGLLLLAVVLRRWVFHW